MAAPGSGARPRQGPTPNPEVFRPVGLAGGIDTKTDYKLVQPPKTLQALNVRYGTAGSVRKRYGISALSSLAGAISCLSTNTELLVCDSATMYAVGVGTGALTSRGSVGAASVTSSNITSIGTLPTQTLRTVTTDYLSTGGVNYGLAAYEYGYTPPTTGTTYNGMDVGGTIYLVLFNATSGAIIWSTSTIGVPVGAYAQVGVARLINPAGATTFTYGSVVGASYPVVTAYKTQFCVSWVGAQPGSSVTDNGTTFSGVLYTAQTICFTPGTTVPISGNSPTPTSTTVCSPSPAVIMGQPTSTTTAYSPVVTAPLFFDVRASASDILLLAAGQNYGAISGTVPATYRTPGSLALFTNAAAFAPSPNVAAPTIPTASTNCAVTLAPSPGLYGAVYAAGYVLQLLTLNFATPAITTTATGTLSGASNNGVFNYPFTAMFNTQSSPTAVVATDGVQVANYAVIASPASIGTYGLFALSLDAALPNSYLTNSQIASRAFVFNGQTVVWLNLSSVLRSTLSSLALYVLPQYNQLTSSLPLAHAAYLRNFTLGYPTDTLTVTGAQPYPRQASVASFNSPSGAPTIAYAANTNPQENTVSVRSLGVGSDTLGTARNSIRTPQGVLYLGADPKYYDGNTCRTMGFLKLPEYNFQGNSAVVTATTLANYTPSTYSNQGLCYSTTYTFFFVLVDYDAQGNVIYGSPSPAMAFTTLGTATKYVLFIPAMMIPTRGFLQVYRNTGLNPLTYVKTRQFSQSDIKSYGGIYNGVVDDTGTGTAINSNGVSTEILSGGLLYSPPSGGEIANDPPPASSMGVATKQRIFLVSQENPTWVYFSKPFYPGRAPEFNAGQFLDIDPTSGPITGIAALDTTIVVFKKAYIYSFSGDGPDATGNGAFTPTIQVATDTGCLDTPSVLTTEQGVWFRSVRGLEMLSRGGQVSYAAPEVEALLQNTTVSASCIVAAQNQLRFSLTSGNVLVYDYLLSAWSVFVPMRPGSASVSSPSSYTSLNNSLFCTNAAGDLCLEGAGFQDGTNNLAMTLQSAWINVAGPQGWGRIRRVSLLGDFRSAHSLTCSFSYDFAATAAYSIPYTASTSAQQNPYSWRVRAPRQVCQAVQITLTDNAPAGEGAIITGLVLELGPKSQALRVPDTQSV